MAHILTVTLFEHGVLLQTVINKCEVHPYIVVRCCNLNLNLRTAIGSKIAQNLMVLCYEVVDRYKLECGTSLHMQLKCT